MERRPERVAHRVQAELARLLLRELRDPRLRDVHVSAVRMTPDLRVARVFVRTLAGPEAAPAALAGFARATPFIRGCLGRALGLRHVPELRFEYDTVVDDAARVEVALAGARAAWEPKP
ncbi:MAG TPA: 30S ribosome-binding factor RbfA [Candidatus Limnocylindria bacterium]|nr:30S ribosome-binding factor RbfA [Candidatus Limnocylindria bacterium]